MPSHLPYRLLADVVLVVHFGIVVFVVGGLAAVYAGKLLGWRRVNGRGFRAAHGAAIATVVAESWLGLTCPLTTLEARLRSPAGAVPQAGGFVEHWVQRLLFFEAPPWVFVAAYTVFGLLVAAAWWYFPPQRRRTAGDAGP